MPGDKMLSADMPQSLKDKVRAARREKPRQSAKVYASQGETERDRRIKAQQLSDLMWLYKEAASWKGSKLPGTPEMAEFEASLREARQTIRELFPNAKFKEDR